MRKLKKGRTSISWSRAPDINQRVVSLFAKLDNPLHISARVFCFRSSYAKTRAIARIWGFAKIWQLALDEKPAYIIEVISEKFDSLPPKKQDEVLLHEIAHIPNNFSGALVPHIRRGKRNFSDKVKQLIKWTSI